MNFTNRQVISAYIAFFLTCSTNPMISRFMPARYSNSPQIRTQFQHHKFQHHIPTAIRVPRAASLVQQSGRQVNQFDSRQFSKLAHAVPSICKRTNLALPNSVLHSKFIPRLPNSFTPSGSVTKHVGAMPVGNASKRTLVTPTKLKNSADRDAELIWAAKIGRTDTVRFLIENGADVNAKSNGYTTLLKGAENSHTNTVEHLIIKNADAMVENKKIETENSSKANEKRIIKKSK